MINLAHYLQLTRPLAVMDLETTGLDPAVDRIWQIAITKHYPDKDPVAWSTLVNPQIDFNSVPQGWEEKGLKRLTAAMFEGAPTFAQVAPALAPKILDVDIAGYNVDFDIGFMRAEMARAGIDWPWNGYVIDAFPIYRLKRPHNLSNAYLEYGGEDGSRVDESFEGAHDASKDVPATEMVIRGQLLRYGDLPRTVPELADICFPNRVNAIDREGKVIWHNGEACINFGKHARNGPRPLRLLDRGYMEWILGATFPDDLKKIMRDAIQGVYPEKK